MTMARTAQTPGGPSEAGQGGQGDPAADALLEASDLVADCVEGLELLGDAAPRFRGKLAKFEAGARGQRTGRGVAPTATAA